MAINQVCVYCASSDTIHPEYKEKAAQLAKILVDHNIKVVYGGGGTGLMGQIADTVLENNGQIVGIMPHFMKAIEWDHKDVKEFVFVEDMHERKKSFLIDTDALIALPGGCGTLEELFEAITLKKLGLLHCPIFILNTRGYYNFLIQLLETSIQEGFMTEENRQLWTVIDEPDDLIPYL